MNDRAWLRRKPGLISPRPMQITKQAVLIFRKKFGRIDENSHVAESSKIRLLFMMITPICSDSQNNCAFLPPFPINQSKQPIVIQNIQQETNNI